MATVDELRKELVKNGLSQDEANQIKGKTNLLEKLKELNDEAGFEEADLDAAEITRDAIELLDENTNAVPDRTSPEWTDYVLSLLTDDEKVGGNPTTDALRRIANKLIGTITRTSSEVVQVPTPENKERATVRVYLEIEDRIAGPIVVTGCADSYYGNTDKNFKAFPVAVAETRAEGRALKRALLLRKIISAEEVAKDVVEIDPIDSESAGRITGPQIQFLETVCRDKLGVNVTKLVNKHFPDAKNINELAYGDALELCKILSSYQSTKVPEELKGYDTNWKSSLVIGE